MEEVRIISPTGAYVAFNYKGGRMCDKNEMDVLYNVNGEYHTGSYYLLEWDGLHPDITPYTTQGYQQHGTTLQNVFLGERTINLKVLTAADVNGFYGTDTARFFYQMRKAMFDVMNPLQGEVVIEYTNDYATRMITAYCSQLPKEDRNLGTGRIYDIELVATYSFWRDLNAHSVVLQEATGGFRFGKGILMFDPTRRFGNLLQTQSLMYDGEADTPVKITIQSANGCDNPKVILNNANGTYYCGINAHISGTDKFVIDTSYGAKKVWLNGQSAARYLMPQSTFFQLTQGENLLTMETDSGSAVITVEYTNQYVTP